MKDLSKAYYLKSKIIILLVLFNFYGYADPVNKYFFNLKLKGVYESNISLIKFDGQSYKQKICTENSIKDQISIPINTIDLPGQFILRIEYKLKQHDHPYPTEIPVFLSKRNISWKINPMHVSGDSLDLSRDLENYIYRQFAKTNILKRKKLEILENLLMEYGRENKSLYLKVVKEYEKQRSYYNNWIDSIGGNNDSLFVSHLIQLSKIPQTNWKLEGQSLIQNKIDHFLDFFDFNDSNMVYFQDVNAMINKYMVMHSMLGKNKNELKKQFIEVGEKLIDRASSGHPLVYGWMTDFLYRGFEQFDIPDGIKMLEPHINNPQCLTKKRIEIEKRLSGMNRLTNGSIAPDFNIDNFNFYTFNGNNSPYKLLLFWSAECSHCQKLLDEIKNWSNETSNLGWMDIIAINMDSKDKIDLWKSTSKNYSEWTHLHPKDDINSEVASKYAILSTPVFFLIDSKSHKLVSSGSELTKITDFF